MVETNELTKLTVNMTPRAMAALSSAAERLGDTQTDTVNRAVQLYAHVTDLVPGERMTFDLTDGKQMTLQRVDALHRAWLLATVAVLMIAAFWAGVVLG